jgi:ATP-dependent Clp protease ATP-binding subunit ClpA
MNAATPEGNGSIRFQAWELFVPEARQVVADARRKAIELNNSTITPEHLLWGLLQPHGGGAVNVLDLAGVSVTGLQNRLDEKLRMQAGSPFEPPVAKPRLTSAAQKALEVAVEIARYMPLRDTFVGSEHLLLALLDEHQDTTVAQRLLLNFGAYLDVSWQATMKRLRRQDKLWPKL